MASLDCGTNSTRLLIVDAAGGVLERRMCVTRLGEGVDATHRLSPAAIERTVAVLADYRALMDSHGVGRARLAATSAARDAENAADFLTAATAATGVRPELLSGADEGRLSFVGATAQLPRGWDRRERVLVVDIGGGSTELVVGAPDNPDDAVAVSIDVGCVRLTERFLHHDPPTAEELGAARRSVDAALADAARTLPPLPPGGAAIGLAGTVSTLAAMTVSMEEYRREAIHHVVISRDEVEGWLRRLAAEDTAARAARRGMDPGRADVIVGGVLVLAAAMADFDRPSCLVSEDDILDGMAASLLATG